METKGSKKRSALDRTADNGLTINMAERPAGRDQPQSQASAAAAAAAVAGSAAVAAAAAEAKNVHLEALQVLHTHGMG